MNVNNNDESLVIASGFDLPDKVLILGCGSIGQCVVPLLLRDMHFDPIQITICEMVDTVLPRIADSIAAGVKFELNPLTQENMAEFLSERVSTGDVILDLAWNIQAESILTWCHNHGVRYLNTSTEEWDPYADVDNKPPTTRTLYHRHMGLRAMIKKWGGNKGPSAIIEHGANPGWVSHEVKYALEQLAEELLKQKLLGENNTQALQTALQAGNYALVAEACGVKAIQISERDTQLTDRPKEVNEFVNTWSGEGFYEEGIAPAELGWGSHELTLPRGALEHKDDGPRNQILIQRAGMETHVRTWIPGGTAATAISGGGESIGMLIRHGEAFTMSEHLTVLEKDGKVRYRPTVYYAYCPSDSAVASVHELRGNNWAHPEKFRLLNNDITAGEDRLGVLLLGHPLKAWWSGSLMSIAEARSILPGHSATTLQVAGSVIAGLAWMLRHPNEGLRVPDELPHNELLEDTRHYLGTCWSGAVDWTPLQNRFELFPVVDPDQEASSTASRDPWQFASFTA